MKIIQSINNNALLLHTFLWGTFIVKFCFTVQINMQYYITDRTWFNFANLAYFLIYKKCFQLKEPIIFDDKQKPIMLPTLDPQENDDVTIVAWGSTGFLKPRHNDLQKLDAQYMSANKCRTKVIRLLTVHDKEFCTLISRGTGVCNVRNQLFSDWYCSS